MARNVQDPNVESSVTRNVHLYNDDGEVVGGIYQNGTLRNDHIYSMCPHFLTFSPQNTPWSIFSLNSNGSTGQQLPNNAANVTPGRYIIISPGMDASPVAVYPNSDPFPRRIVSRTGTSRLTPRRNHFRQAVRARDSDCVISGLTSPHVALGRYEDFEAAHIFPHAMERDWIAGGFSRYITDNTPIAQTGTSRIHSVQNGLLLDIGVHHQFDTFAISVNPDDNYRVTCFKFDARNIDGRTLAFQARNPQNPQQVSPDLLRWHFRMAVLANVRGPSGEQPWEMDFPEGDKMGEIMEGPFAAERMETGLFHRLGPGETID